MAIGRIRPVSHDDNLTVIEHISELRLRVIACLAVFGIAFIFCFWQNEAILRIINEPLKAATATLTTNTGASTGATPQTKALYLELAQLSRTAAAELDNQRLSDQFSHLAGTADSAAKSIDTTDSKNPITLGVGEPFTATLQIVFYAAILLSLPALLYQLYAYILPAFTKREQNVALPLMLAIPGLFLAGAFFGYYVVLPPTLDFLQNFNSQNFDIMVQARQYYSFIVFMLIAMGLVFQLPIAVLAITRLGLVTPKQLKQNRRYAVITIAALAMLLPGTDPVSMMVEMVPLLILYEGSVQVASILERRRNKLNNEAVGETQ